MEVCTVEMFAMDVLRHGGNKRNVGFSKSVDSTVSSRHCLLLSRRSPALYIVENLKFLELRAQPKEAQI